MPATGGHAASSTASADAPSVVTDATFMPAGVETMTQASASKRWTIAGGFGGSSASHAALAAHTVAEAARTNEGIAMM